MSLVYSQTSGDVTVQIWKGKNCAGKAMELLAPQMQSVFGGTMRPYLVDDYMLVALENEKVVVGGMFMSISDATFDFVEVPEHGTKQLNILLLFI